MRHAAATAPRRTRGSRALRQALVQVVALPAQVQAGEQGGRMGEVERLASACAECAPAVRPDVATGLLLMLVAMPLVELAGC